MGYRWVRAGDLNAFFGLALDNVSNLVLLWGILVSVFGFPVETVLYRMIPGTAIGVLVGDLIYTWMAFRLARRTGRDDVTAMPLGIDTPSLFALTFGVLGPAYLATKDAEQACATGRGRLIHLVAGGSRPAGGHQPEDVPPRRGNRAGRGPGALEAWRPAGRGDVKRSTGGGRTAGRR